MTITDSAPAALEPLLGKSSEKLVIDEDLLVASGDVSRVVSSSFVVRSFNASFFGRCEVHPNVACDCVVRRPSMASCGRTIAESQRILVEVGDDGRLRTSQLATCKSAWVCDFCAPRLLVDAVERGRFHLEAHLGRGGSVFHLTLTVPHRLGDSLAGLMASADAARGKLQDSTAWKGLGLSSWVRVLQVKYSLVTGWNPHFHILLFFPPGVCPVVSEVEASLRTVWNSRLEKQSGRQAGKASTMVTSPSGVESLLYPWRYGEGDEDLGEEYHPDAFEDWWELEAEHDPSHPDFDESVSRETSLSPWLVARVAAAGGTQAACLWREYYEATKGRPVVSYSKDLRVSWKVHQEAGAPVAERSLRPVALVESRVWNAAHFRRGGAVSDAAFRVAEGAECVVDVLAQFWADALGRPVGVSMVDVLGVRLPFVHFTTEKSLR